MINIKRDYVFVQIMNIIFSILSYCYVKYHLLENQEKSFGNFLALLAVFLGAVYVFYTNRIFHIMLRDGLR